MSDKNNKNYKIKNKIENSISLIESTKTEHKNMAEETLINVGQEKILIDLIDGEVLEIEHQSNELN